MEGSALVAVSCACAFACGVLLLAPWVARFDRRVRRKSRRGGSDDAASLLTDALARGFRPLLTPARILLSYEGVHELVGEWIRFAQLKGYIRAQEEAALSSLLACCVVGTALFWVLLGSLASGLAVVFGAVACGAALVRGALDKHDERVRQAVPDAVQALRACFQTGYSLEQTLEHLAQNTTGDLAALFARALQALRLGCSATEALEVLRTDERAPELVFVTAALDVQHQAGGSLASILATAERAARARFDLERSLQTQTAQARLSARIVSVMPFVLVAVFSLISQGFMDPFFESAAGVALFVAALAMEFMGIMGVRKVLKVEGVRS